MPTTARWWTGSNGHEIRRNATTSNSRTTYLIVSSKDASNMALSPDGKAVFMAPNGVTMTVGDVPSMKAIKTITFSDHVRPFVINHDATHVYANLNNLLGFEIADVKTGEVIKRIEAPAEMWKAK